MFRNRKKTEPTEKKPRPIKKCSFCKKDSINSNGKVRTCDDNICATKYYKKLKADFNN